MKYHRLFVAVCALLTFAYLSLLFPRIASAQIKQPGAHARYTLELEPHLVLMWNRGPRRFNDEGIGVGLRASIPFFHNGPIDSINNSMGITFGADYAYFDVDDRRYCRELGPAWCDRQDDYDASVFWFPVAMQWNFFFHPKIAVFGEVGMAFEHTRWSFALPCRPMSPELCEVDDSDTDFFQFVFAAGGRFMLWDSVGLTVRLGLPEITAGVSFLL
jgi:hypothetical protein